MYNITTIKSYIMNLKDIKLAISKLPVEQRRVY